VFISWARLSRRTVDLARELDVELLHISSKPPYLNAFLETLNYLKKVKPNVVMVQLPQGPLLWEVVFLSKRLGFKVVADVHTGFIYTTTLKEILLNRPFHHYLKYVDLMLVHNEEVKKLVLKKFGNTIKEEKLMVVYDPIPKPLENLEMPKNIDVRPSEYLVMPASWASDEPIDFLVDEFINYLRMSKSNYKLVITNDYTKNISLYKRVIEKIKKANALDKVLLTGYLKKQEYYWLLANAKLVIALTSREYTMLSAIWDAVGYNIPFIVSETTTLKNIIGNYPCFFKIEKNFLTSTLMRCIDTENLMDSFTKVSNRLKELSSKSIETLRKVLNQLNSLTP